MSALRHRIFSLSASEIAQVLDDVDMLGGIDRHRSVIGAEHDAVGTEHLDRLAHMGRPDAHRVDRQMLLEIGAGETLALDLGRFGHAVAAEPPAEIEPPHHRQEPAAHVRDHDLEAREAIEQAGQDHARQGHRRVERAAHELVELVLVHLLVMPDRHAHRMDEDGRLARLGEFPERIGVLRVDEPAVPARADEQSLEAQRPETAFGLGDLRLVERIDRAHAPGVVRRLRHDRRHLVIAVLDDVERRLAAIGRHRFRHERARHEAPRDAGPGAHLLLQGEIEHIAIADRGQAAKIADHVLADDLTAHQIGDAERILPGRDGGMRVNIDHVRHGRPPLLPASIRPAEAVLQSCRRRNLRAKAPRCWTARMLYRGMDKATLDRAYNIGAATGLERRDRIIADWTQRTAALGEKVGARRDLRYGDGPRHRLDFYPCGRAGAATLVFLHGGYWQFSDKENYGCLAAGPLAHGINVALPEYTLAPAIGIDGMVAEVRQRARMAAARRACAELRRRRAFRRRPSRGNDDGRGRRHRRPAGERALRSRADPAELRQRQARHGRGHGAAQQPAPPHPRRGAARRRRVGRERAAGAAPAIGANIATRCKRPGATRAASCSTATTISACWKSSRARTENSPRRCAT